MRKFLNEFREFAVKGNFVELAIGIVIGTAFNKIVSSLVNDVIMPPFGLIWGQKNFTNYKWILRPEEKSQNGELIFEEVAMNFGSFLKTTVDFMIIAFSIYLLIRTINAIKKKAEDETDASVPTPKDIRLLAEIRDLLKSKGN